MVPWVSSCHLQIISLNILCQPVSYQIALLVEHQPHDRKVIVCVWLRILRVPSCCFLRFAHWRLFIICKLNLALIIFKLEICMRTHFKGSFAGYPYILHGINNNTWGSLECRFWSADVSYLTDCRRWYLGISSKSCGLAHPILFRC